MFGGACFPSALLFVGFGVDIPGLWILRFELSLGFLICGFWFGVSLF